MEEKRKKYIVTAQWNSEVATKGLDIKFFGLSNKEKLSKIRNVIKSYMGEERWIVETHKRR